MPNANAVVVPNAELVATAKRVRARVAKGWCQREYARNKWRKPVDIHSPSAERFCIRGAAHAESKKYGDYHLFITNFQTWLVGPGALANGLEALTEWNDKKGQTKKKVVAALDSFIESLG